MTTGSLQNRQLPRQPMTAAVPRTVRAQAAAAPAVAIDADDEFRMNLGDLPRLPPGLQVDGFAPSLTSRVLDLFDRLRRR